MPSKFGSFSSHISILAADILARSVATGLTDENHPQSFYKYSLLDPLDQPLAVFRYNYEPLGRYSSVHNQLLRILTGGTGDLLSSGIVQNGGDFSILSSQGTVLPTDIS